MNKQEIIVEFSNLIDRYLKLCEVPEELESLDYILGGLISIAIGKKLLEVE